MLRFLIQADARHLSLLALLSFLVSSCSLCNQGYSSMGIFDTDDSTWCSRYPVPYMSDAKWRQQMARDLSSRHEQDRHLATLYFRHTDKLKQCTKTLQGLSLEEMTDIADKLYEAFSSAFESKGVAISDIRDVCRYASESHLYNLDQFIPWDRFYNGLPPEIRADLPQEEALIIFDMHCARILLQYIEQNDKMPSSKRKNARNMAYYVLLKSDGEKGDRAYFRDEFYQRMHFPSRPCKDPRSGYPLAW